MFRTVKHVAANTHGPLPVLSSTCLYLARSSRVLKLKTVGLGTQHDIGSASCLSSEAANCLTRPRHFPPRIRPGWHIGRRRAGLVALNGGTAKLSTGAAIQIAGGWEKHPPAPMRAPAPGSPNLQRRVFKTPLPMQGNA